MNKNGSARAFAEEMEKSGTVERFVSDENEADKRYIRE